MTIQSAIAAELPFLRAEAESRMTSRVTVRRRVERDGLDDVTDAEVVGWEAVYVDLPFRLAGTYRGDSPSRTISIGGTERQVAVRTGNFPASTNDLADNDMVEITAGENAGQVLRIIEADFQDQATARRVPVEAANAPEGGWS